MVRDHSSYQGFSSSHGRHTARDHAVTNKPPSLVKKAHWQIVRAKSLMRAVDVRSETGSEELLTVSSTRGVVPRSSATVSMFRAASYAGHKLCWPDDLVINSLWAWGRGLGVARHHGIVSTAYGVYRLRANAKVNPAYLHQLVRSDPYQWELQVRSQGVWKSRLQMTDARWLDAPLVVPPLEEQAAIVKYLAHANARIDKAINAKRRLIALLDEEKSAQVECLLDDAMTAGEVPMLGRALRRIEQGTSPSPAEGGLADDQWAVLSLSAVNRGRFAATALKPVDLSFAVPTSMEVHDGDLLMTRSNTRERVGDVAIANGVRPRTIIPDLIYRLVPREDLLLVEFASLALRSRRLRNQIEVLARGSSDTMPKLAQGHIRSLHMPLPSLEQQAHLVARARSIVRPIETAIDRASGEIDLLSEFRTRLVADVVTGQVDVREIVGTLPEIDLSAVGAGSVSGVDTRLVELDDVMETSED